MGSFIGVAVNYHGDFMRNKRIERKKQTESTSILKGGLTARLLPLFAFFFSHPLLLFDGHDFLKLSMGRAGGQKGDAGGNGRYGPRR